MAKRKRKVYCKELGLAFDSIQEAALTLDLHEKCIWRCCNHLQKRTKKLTFKYYEDYMEEIKNGK